jgi:integrase/recombinase XerD
MATVRIDIERYVRWLQDVRRFQPSTVSRRLSVVVGFYRVCVIDALLPNSPAAYVRRPPVPAESPTLGLGHLQFEALITAARLSTNPYDLALVALLGLLGLRIFEACGANIDDLREEHGHRVLRVRGKGGKIVLVPLPPAVGIAIDRASGDRTGGPILLNALGRRMDRHAASRRLKHLAATANIRMSRMHPHMLRHTFVTTMLDAGVSLRDVPGRRPPRRPTHHHALRPRPQDPRPPPQLHPRRLHGVGNVATRTALPMTAHAHGIQFFGCLSLATELGCVYVPSRDHQL